MPTLAALALAAGGVMFCLRARRRKRQRNDKLAVLAANGMGSGTPSNGNDKASDLLKAMAIARPVSSNPLARLAAVDWELDPVDLEVATGEDGAEVREMREREKKKEHVAKDSSIGHLTGSSLHPLSLPQIELGNGASGRVIKGRYRVTGQDVAIKILRAERCADAGDERALEELAKEILMLRAARHPNIVSFVGASIRDGAPPILVVELMPRGDLYRALDNPRYAPVFKWARALGPDGKPRPYSGYNRRIALDVARGLAYLHSRGIVHLDVKSLNVLLAHDLTAKLADCGAARALGDRDGATLTSPAGTLAWMAPEVMTGDRATDKADVYSFGVLLWELSTGERPRRGLRPVTEDEAPKTVCDLIEACLATDPKERPTASDIVTVLESIDDDGQPAVVRDGSGLSVSEAVIRQANR